MFHANRYHHRTPLHFASFWGGTDVVRYLVSKGANKNAKRYDGETHHMMLLGKMKSENSSNEEKHFTQKN